MSYFNTVFIVLGLITTVGAESPTFENDVAPLLNKYCVGCHSTTDAEADLVLDSYAGLVKGGENGTAINQNKSDQSLLLTRILGTTEPKMPPEDEPQLSEEDVRTIVEWVKAGAKPPATNGPEIRFDQVEGDTGPHPVTALAFRPLMTTGRDLAVGSFKTVSIYGNASASARVVLEAPGKVHAVEYGAKGGVLVAASGIAGLRGDALLWNADDGELLRRFSGHDDSIYCVAISDDGSRIATGSYDRKIIIWDAKTGKQIRTLSGHNGAIYDLDFGLNGTILASASADTTVKVWHVSSGKRLDTLGQPLKEQYCVDISPDSQWIAAGGADNRIRMWRLESTETPQINPLVHSRFAHQGDVEQIAFTANGRQLVSSSSDQTRKSWQLPGLDLLEAFELQPSETGILATTPDSRQVALGRNDGRWNLYPLRDSAIARKTVAANHSNQRFVRTGARQTFEEQEPNNTSDAAQLVQLPAKISGHIWSPEQLDRDQFRFAAKKGEEWILEIKAAQDDSKLDSHIAILDTDGTPVPRVQLQAVRDSYFTFRGKDSNGVGDFRLHNWEEMRLNQYLYSAGEVVKLYHYPRGPDSGFNVYPNFGKRRGYFDTTPLAHALHEPAYIVEPHRPGEDLPPNGLPVFLLNYENDDDSLRRLGKDSRLTFIAPHDGEYVVSVTDVRGMQGEDFHYSLMIRPPSPDFSGKVLNADLKVVPGSQRRFGIEVERADGFDGPIDVRVSNLPPGFSVPGPLQIEAGHDRLWGILRADLKAPAPNEEQWKAVKVTGAANILGQRVEHELGTLGKIEVDEKPKLFVELVPDTPSSHDHPDYPVIELVAGESTTASIKIKRVDHTARAGFGSEDAAVNSPHGVYVANIGLNGVLIVEGQNERQFFIRAEPWVKPMERVIFVESGDAGKPCSNPVLLRILPAESPRITDQAAR